MSRPWGYWKDWDNVRQEVAQIIDRFGTVPSCRILEIKGYSGFVKAIRQHWGSVERVRRALGVSDGRRADGAWNPGHWTETAFEEVIEEIIKRYGNIPPKDTLMLDGYPSTVDKLIRGHGGYEMLRYLHGLPEWEPIYPPWVQKGER
jgi:hypothetical protein